MVRFYVLITVLFQPFGLIFAAALRRSSERGRQDAISAAAFFAYGMAPLYVAVLLVRWRPVTIDAQLLSLDAALGLNPLHFAHWVGAHAAVQLALLIPYELLAVVLAVVWMLEQSATLRRAFLLGGILCFAFYYAFPAVGPAFAQDATHGARNCMPSMHLAWALLLAWNARAKWLQGTLWTYAVLIALATIGLGQHYYVDLIAAAPYAMVVQWTARRLEGFSLSHVRRVAESALTWRRKSGLLRDESDG